MFQNVQKWLIDVSEGRNTRERSQLQLVRTRIKFDKICLSVYLSCRRVLTLFPHLRSLV